MTPSGGTISWTMPGWVSPCVVSPSTFSVVYVVGLARPAGGWLICQVAVTGTGTPEDESTGERSKVPGMEIAGTNPILTSAGPSLPPSWL
jgi:hypothetical protein